MSQPPSPSLLRLVIAALTAAAIAPGLVACGDGDDTADGDAWRIGLEAPLSGDLRTLGEGMLKGAELAADEINGDGGLEGRDVEIVPIDDGGDPKTGVAAAKRAIADGLDGVVGPYNSGVGVKTLPLYTDAGLVPIRLTSDNATDGEGFTLQPMSDQIAPVTSEAITEYLGAKTVAIAYDSTQVYTRSVSRGVRDELGAAGAEVVAYEPVEPGRKSYDDVVASLAAGGADAIYSAVYSPEGALIAKAMRSQGVESSCLLDYATYDSAYIEVAGLRAAQVCPVVGVPAPNDFPDSGAYVDAYEGKFGDAPDTWSPYTYDSVNLLAYGVDQAGGFDATQLTDVLNDVDGWTGWTGSVTIDPSNGNRQPATVVVDEVTDSGEFHIDRSWAQAVGAPD